jgi:HlyD family secretion protein
MKPLALLLIGFIIGCAAPNTNEASGTIEFTQTDVSAMVPARVVRVDVNEGDIVHAGDTIAVLAQTGLPQDIEQRRARVAAAEAEVRDLLRGARPEELERASSELRSAQAEATRTAQDSVRIARLLTAGAVSQSEFDAVASAAKVAGARRDAARDALQLLQAGARPERIAAARAALASARAQLAMAEAAAGDLVLTAPTSGRILGRHAQPGEVLPAGVPVVSLGDPLDVWVRVYVAAPLFAKIRVGDVVPLTIDGVPDREFEARVIALATEAEFTPRVALTEDERADLLFGVKLQLTDTTGTLKAGLPATARFAVPPGTGTGDGRPMP